MIHDWYDRLLASGVMDTLSPYTPVVVGAYPLGIAGAALPIEIVCRSVDLPAFGRVVERTYGGAEGFGCIPGALDDEEAVFAEFELDGLPLEVAAQREHVHQRLAAATLGILACSTSRATRSRARLAAAGRPAARTGWRPRSMQTGLSRAAIEALARPRTRR